MCSAGEMDDAPPRALSIGALAGAPPRMLSIAALVGVVAALVVSLAIIWGVPSTNMLASRAALATGGWVQQPLVSSAVIALLVAAVMLAAGTRRLDDVGLRRRDAGPALVVLGVAWAALQICALVRVLLAGERVTAGDALRAPVGLVVGAVLAQLLGTTLVEEVVFRGILLRQLVLRAQRRTGDRGRGMMIGVAIAALIFAGWHLPQRLTFGHGGLELVGNLVGTGLGGVLGSYLYLRSGNLLLVVVLHAWFNEPIPLVSTPFPAQWLLVVPLVGIVFWIEYRARRAVHAT
jgi:membrane protease YdiL (CAAX protease family)